MESSQLQTSAQHSSALRTCGQKVTHLAIQPNVGGQALKCFRSTVFVLGETAAGQRLCKEHPSQDRPFRTRLTSLCGGIYTSIGLKTNLYLGHLVWISANLLLKSGWASQRTRAPCQPYGSTSNLLDSTQKHELPTCRERERESSVRCIDLKTTWDSHFLYAPVAPASSTLDRTVWCSYSTAWHLLEVLS